MKSNKFLFIFLIALPFSSLLSACLSGKDDKQIHTYSNENIIEKTNPDDLVYKVDPELSEFKWIGYNLSASRIGTVNISRGGIMVDKDDNFIDGQFIIDMTSIKSEDNGLDVHLMNKDFFEVNVYPESTLHIVSIENNRGVEDEYIVQGDLTIMDTTNPIDFIASITNQNDSQITVESSFKLDRTLWGITYGSSKFEETVIDKIISDEFDVDVKIVLNLED